MAQQIFSILGLIAATALVLFLAWAILKFMNSRMSGGTSVNSNRPIKVLDRIQLGKSGSLMLVRVHDKVFLIAMNEHAAETIYTFDDPDGSIDIKKMQEMPGFSQALKDALKKTGIGGKANKEDKSREEEIK